MPSAPRKRAVRQDTLAQAGIGSGIVTSQMLVDNINGMDAELTAQRRGRPRVDVWPYRGG